jgi:hypothetical protein
MSTSLQERNLNLRAVAQSYRACQLGGAEESRTPICWSRTSGPKPLNDNPFSMNWSYRPDSNWHRSITAHLFRRQDRYGSMVPR